MSSPASTPRDTSEPGSDDPYYDGDEEDEKLGEDEVESKELRYSDDVVASLILNEPYQLRSLINFGKQSKASHTCIAIEKKKVNICIYSQANSGTPPFFIMGEIPITSTLGLYTRSNYNGLYTTKELSQSLSIVKKTNQVRIQVMKGNMRYLYVNTDINSPDLGQCVTATSVNSENAYTDMSYPIEEDAPNLRVATNAFASRIKLLINSEVKSIDIVCYKEGVKLIPKEATTKIPPMIIGKVEAKEEETFRAYCSPWLLKALSKLDTSFGSRSTTCFYWDEYNPLKLMLPLGSIGKISIVFAPTQDS